MELLLDDNVGGPCNETVRKGLQQEMSEKATHQQEMQNFRKEWVKLDVEVAKLLKEPVILHLTFKYHEGILPSYILSNQHEGILPSYFF